MFKGEDSVNLDSKGRLAIPSRQRSTIMKVCAGKMTITVNGNRKSCLSLYPKGTWEEVASQVAALSDFDPNHVDLKSNFIGRAVDVEMDSSGRVLLPPRLREFAELSKAVDFIGFVDKFELWSPELWGKEIHKWKTKKVKLKDISEEQKQISL